jgi:2-isopropylmalate synthase
MLSSIFDWNTRAATAQPASPPSAWTPFGGATARGVHVVDETLRDGLQSVSGVNPPVSFKVDLLHAMARIGVNVVSVGLPAAGPANAEDCYLLCREIQAARLPLIPTAAARTVPADVQGIARAAERAGMPIEVYSFIGSSPIRHAVEGWSLDFLVRAVTSSVEEAVRAGLDFCLVTEDTTRSHPDVLRALFRAAIDAGAKRLCLCDTTGHVTPYGVEELVDFTRHELQLMGATHVGLDWHAHNDRGLALATALWAASIGVDRVHGCGLSIGERVGNTNLELLVDNLGRAGIRKRVPDQHLIEYCELTARALSWSIPTDHPIAGELARAQADLPRPYRSVASGGDDESEEALVSMTLRIGGEPLRLAVPPRRTLLEALRYDLDLIGTKQGCDKGDCGACTVVVDGQAVLSCLTLALAADGSDVKIVELLQGAPHVDPILDCFDKAGGGQCGFCTPGMLMSATALLDRDPSPSRAAIQAAISGNLCRCTGYGRIVDSIEEAAKIRRGEATGGEDLPGSECLPPPHPSNTRTKKTEG